MHKSIAFLFALFVTFAASSATPKWWTVSDTTELARIKPGNTSNSRTDGDLAFVEDIDEVSAPFYGIYVYSKAEEEDADGANVVDCVSGPGQWILVSSGINFASGDTLELKRKRDNVLRAFYSYATDGGAVGNITLRGEVFPNGSVPLRCSYWVDTAFTSGGSATVVLQYNYTGSSWATILSSTAFDTAGTEAMHDTTLTTASTTRYQIDKTGGATIRMVVGTAALTAGKLALLCEFIFPED